MATHLQKRQIQGLSGGTIAWKNPDGSAMSGYTSPNLQGIDYAHKGKVDKILNQAGNTGAIVITDEYIELSFYIIPQGADSAHAIQAAIIPQLGATATITGLPVIKIGSFTDGLNSVAESPWIYEGDASGSGKVSAANWDGKFTLRRYVDITDATATT